MNGLEALWEQIRPGLSKLVGSITPFLLTKLAMLFGVTISPTTQEIVTYITWSLISYAIMTYLVSRGVNPGNAASPRIAKMEAAQEQELKITERQIKEMVHGSPR